MTYDGETLLERYQREELVNERIERDMEKPAAYIYKGSLLYFPCEVAPTNNPDTDPDYVPLYRAAGVKP